VKNPESCLDEHGNIHGGHLEEESLQQNCRQKSADQKVGGIDIQRISIHYITEGLVR